MNDFSNKKLLSSSEKIMLVKIEAKTYLGEGALLVDGTITLPFTKGNLQKITATYISRTLPSNSKEVLTFTEVQSNPTLHQYTYDSINGTVTLYLKSATDYYLTAHYSMTFANGIDRVTGINPLLPTENQVSWRGVLLEMPTTSIDLSDSIVGTYSQTSSTITIANEFGLTKLISDNESFSKTPITVYVAIDDLENIKSIFVGTVSDLTISDSSIVFNLKDFVNSLDKSASFGDNDTELFTPSANVQDNDRSLPVPLIYGNSSRYAEIGNTYGVGLPAYVNISHGYDLDHESLNRAVCTSYNATIATNVNRTYTCCRVENTADIAVTILSVITDFFGNDMYEVADISRLTLGDTLNNAANDKYIRITRTMGNYFYIKSTEFSANPVVGEVFQTNSLPTVVISGGEDELPIIYLAYGKHYTATETTTSGGNKLVKIVFNNNFEADAALAPFFGGSKILDPSKHKVHYKVRPDGTNHKHGTVLKSLLTYAGLEVDDASITAANTVLNANVQFQIPYHDENEYNTYLFYVNEILRSTLGIIRSNNQSKIEYKLLTSPNTTDVRNDNDLDKGSFNVAIDYNDLLYGISAVNKHGYSLDGYNKSVIELRNEKARSLHGVDKIEQFEHVLEDISARLPFILAIRSNRNGKYTFTTKNLDLDSLVYDDVKVEREGLLNNQENVNLKITGISKGATNVEIDALDIIGV